MTKDYRFTEVERETILCVIRWQRQLMGALKQWLTTELRTGPTLFEIYTNDQPVGKSINQDYYLYANDLSLMSQDDTLEVAVNTLINMKIELSTYYRAYHIMSNPMKT